MRERILAIATAMFIERGFAGVAMREISEACGITKAALYYHFTNKAEILLAIMTGYLDEIAQVAATARSQGATCEEQLRLLARGMSHEPQGRRAILRVLMHDMSNLDPTDRAIFRKDYFARFMIPIQEIFAEGEANGEFRKGDPAVLGWVLLGMFYPFWGPEGGAAPEATDATIEAILDVLLFGVADRG